MDIVGYDYTTERSFDTLESAAKNKGSGSNLMNAGIGIGMGLGVGGQFGNQMNSISTKMNTSNKTQNEAKIKCNKCGNILKASEKFCPECGERVGNYCIACGARLSKAGQKFCPECGAPQIFTCPNCKSEIDKNSKFCPECGKKLGGV